jgi:hypothetical protein
LDRVLNFVDRHWKWIVVGVWIAFCLYFVVERWNAIRFFALGDTDDNLR